MLRRAYSLRTFGRWKSRISRNPKNADKFGLLARRLPQIERLTIHETDDNAKRKGRVIDDTYEYFGIENSEDVPQISEPSWGLSRKRIAKAEARREYEITQGVDVNTARVVIECSKPEFNHIDGMKYMRGKGNIPLMSEFWSNSTHKDEWFSIHRVQKELLFDHFDTADHLFLGGETGSGKTVAYAAAIMCRLKEDLETGISSKVVVLVPSALLMEQTVKKLGELNTILGLKIATPDKGDVLNVSDFDVLIATPARAARTFTHVTTKQHVPFVVMDEADNLLDDSFVNEMSDFLAVVPVKHSATNPNPESGARIIFTSATCPSDLQDLVEGLVDGPKIRYLLSENLHRILPNVSQTFIRVREMDKLDRLVELLTADLKSKSTRSIVFCGDNATAKWVSTSLLENGIEAALLSSREVLNIAKVNQQRILVSTDMGSRGLDLSDLTHVINYNFPRHLIDYLHRVGRVGRCSGARQAARATSFVRLAHEVEQVNKIELAARLNRQLNIETDVAGHLRDRNDRKARTYTY